MRFEIEIYRNGTVDALPAPNIYHLSDLNKLYQLYTYVYILKNGKNTVLIDTGCGDVEEINKIQIEKYNGQNVFNIPEDEKIGSILSKANIDPEEVDHVFLTHLHHDHCSNVGLFPNAKIVVSKKGWLEYMKKQRPYYYNPLDFPAGPIDYMASLPPGKILFIEDELEVIEGIKAFWVGGHSPCCMAFEVDTKNGKAVFTSDIAFLINNIKKNHPIGFYYNLWECYEGYKKIRDRADIILTSHDPVILDDLFKKGKI